MEEKQVTLQVEGMTCNHCASTVNGIIQQEGGKDIYVDYLMGEARFELGNTQKLDRILKRLNTAGYASKADTTPFEGASGFSSIEKKFLFTLPFSLVLFSHMFAPHSWWINNAWVQLAICLPVFGMGFYHFGKSTWESLRSGTINMDLLILLGSTSAFIYSLYGALVYGNRPEAHDFLFFETTSTIITLVLLGYVIEHRAVKKTTATLRELFKAQPEKAKKLVKNGLNQDLVVVAASNLRPEDIILVNSGDRVPADGTIIHGQAEVDESMLTGESTPLSKQKDSEVFGGSILLRGNITVKVTRTGTQSTIGQIIALVKTSRADKPAIQKLADRISSWFVPLIVAVALMTFFLNYLSDVSLTNSLLRSIAVLVISCPCAMGLATPTAVSVGLGLAAKMGIIVKKASAFEELNAVNTMVFDKTGTLTKGEPEVYLNDLHPDWKQEEAWGIIRALELHSSHPLASSILKLTEHVPTAELSHVEEIKGMGVRAEWRDKPVRLGSATFTGARVEGDLFLVVGGDVVAVLNVRDTLRPEAADVVKALRGEGFSIHLLSGDSEQKTSDIAAQLGIAHYKGHQLPQEKLQYLKDLQQTQAVAMIGDGINDAPALAAADIGISLGNKHALAAESARIAILGNSLHLLHTLHIIGKKVVQCIRQNLFWAFAYNIIAIPLAAMGYLDPMLAALSMAFSDIVVIGNSLRLRFILPKTIG